MRTSQLLALLTLLGGFPACVVPAAPTWGDPQSNFPPTIYLAEPPVGTILSLAPDAGWPLTVVVGLADQNTNDNLYARWLIDYPPFVDGVSRLARPDNQPGDGKVERPELSFAPNCGDHRIAAGFLRHRLLLAASDRPFASDEPAQTLLDRVPDGNFRVEALWLFDMDCP